MNVHGRETSFEHIHAAERPLPSPAHSDDSLLDLPQIPDLPWERNAKGDWVRTSAGSSYTPSPPPQAPQTEERRSPDLLPSPVTKRSSPLGSSVLAQPTPTARQFARAASTSLLASSSSALHSTPAASSTRLPSSAGLTSTGRKIGRARRVKLEDYDRQAQGAQEDNVGLANGGQSELRMSLSTQGKENAEAANTVLPSSSSSSARPLADVVPLPQPQQRTLSAYGRQMIPVPSRAAARLMKKVETISEVPDGASPFLIHHLSTNFRVASFADGVPHT